MLPYGFSNLAESQTIGILHIQMVDAASAGPTSTSWRFSAFTEQVLAGAKVLKLPVCLLY